MHAAIDGNSIILQPKTKHHIQMLAAIKKTLPMQRHKSGVVVPYNCKSYKILNAKGIKVDHPIRHEHDTAIFCGRYKPMAHQREDVFFLIENERAYYPAAMGVGKTATALWAAGWLLKQKLINRVLITAPLSTLKCVWEAEIWNLLPHCSCAVVHGSPAKRRAAIASGAQFLIINHEGISFTPELEQSGCDLLIIDEIAVHRNAPNTRFRAIRRVMGVLPLRRVWGLTGTPMPTGSPVDLWGQAQLMFPDKFPESQWAFKNKYTYLVTQNKRIPHNWSYAELKTRMQPARYRARDDCLDLPEQIFSYREVNLTPQQEKAFCELKKKMLTKLDNGQQILAVHEGVLITKLMQVALGAVYDGDKVIGIVGIEPRVHAIKEIIEETDGPVLVFASFRSVVELYAKALERYNPVVVHGDVSATHRARIFDAFQRGEQNLIIAHPQTMSHGLTLTKSNTIVWAGPIWSNDIFQQSCARIHRKGQHRSTNIVMLYGTTMEKEIYSKLSHQQKLQGSFLQLLKAKNEN